MIMKLTLLIEWYLAHHLLPCQADLTAPGQDSQIHWMRSRAQVWRHGLIRLTFICMCCSFSQSPVCLVLSDSLVSHPDPGLGSLACHLPHLLVTTRPGQGLPLPSQIFEMCQILPQLQDVRIKMLVWFGLCQLEVHWKSWRQTKIWIHDLFETFSESSSFISKNQQSSQD